MTNIGQDEREIEKFPPKKTQNVVEKIDERVVKFGSVKIE
jgi:hypothetical protein